LIASALILFVCIEPLRAYQGSFPNCDQILSDWIAANIGSKPLRIEYYFEPDPGPGRSSTALVTPVGCDGTVTFDISADAARCRRPAGTSDAGIIRRFKVSKGCL
jgi:hypothetical protein